MSKTANLKLAAIDIGSNAIRLQITNVIEARGESFFKRLQYVRFPLRLGSDVFMEGKLSEGTRKRFLELMKAFKILVDLYEVSDMMACATSALREADNGAEIIEEVRSSTGLEIVIIPGETEARIINDAISDYLTDAPHIHIDVGGGSTELNIFKAGDKINSASFKIGSVRRMQHYDTPDAWHEMEAWVKENAGPSDKFTAVGTGGNITKFLELLGKPPGKNISIRQLREMQSYIKSLSFEERQIELRLNPDRADVIVPASEIYISVMQWAHASRILVPDVGLKDGVLKELYWKHTGQNSVHILK